MRTTAATSSTVHASSGLFGDVATELLIRLDGDEGLFVAYDFGRVQSAGVRR